MFLKKMMRNKKNKENDLCLSTSIQLVKVVDGLLAAWEGGTDTKEALDRVCATLKPSPLTDVCRRVARLLHMGSPAQEVWRRAGAGSGPLDRHLQMLGSALTAETGERHALMQCLSVLESSVQNQFEQAVERTPIVMLAPIVTLILPGIFIVVGAPLLWDVLSMLKH